MFDSSIEGVKKKGRSYLWQQQHFWHSHVSIWPSDDVKDINTQDPYNTYIKGRVSDFSKTF